MRNLIRADLRRVFRKQLYWIFPSIAMILLLSRVISHLLINFVAKFIPILAIGASENVALNDFGNALNILNFALSIVIFIALYTDDFKSMTMIGMFLSCKISYSLWDRTTGLVLSR